MCVNLPLSFDHGWWECGDKAVERAKDRWETGVGGVKGPGETTGDGKRQRGSCYIDFLKLQQIAKIPFHVQKINID